MPRFVYVALPCTDPDWDGTGMEQTGIYLVATLGVNTCSVRVPSLPIWWRHLKFNQSAALQIVSFWTNTEQLRNHLFRLPSITAASSATSGYVVVPERFGENEEPAIGNAERTRKKRSFIPKVDLIDAIVFPRM